MSTLRRILLIATALGLVGAASATATSILRGNRSDGEGFKPIQHAKLVLPAAATAAIPAATLDEALAHLTARVDDPNIEGVELRVVPETESSAGGRVLFLTVKQPGSGPAAIAGVWKAELVAGALRDVAEARGLRAVDNFEIDSRLPDGQLVPTDGGFGNEVTGQLFDVAGTDELEHRISDGLRNAGLKPLSVTAVSALQSAPVVIAETNDPAGFVRQATSPKLWEEILGDYNNLEGYYFELRDEKGEPVVVTAAAHRAGSSLSWTRADLRSPTLITGAIPTGTEGG